MTERSLPEKSAEAYRTIGEAAEELRLPQHVLRFWETRFPQVKPLKRAGGRRFYRPDDVALLGAIKTLLYGQGYTIKGVQRLLQDRGVRALVAAAAVPAEPGRALPTVVEIPTGPDAPVDAESASRTLDPVVERAAMRDDDTSFLSFELPMPARPRRVDGGRGLAPEAEAAASRGGSAPQPRAPDLVARLEAVAFDLGECERLLAAARAPRS